VNIFFIKSLLLIALIATLSACFDSNNSESGDNSLEQNNVDNVKVNSQNTAVILATVNGEVITEDDILSIVSNSFAQPAAVLNDTAIREKILNSLIASKAMMQLAKNDMSPEKLTAINKKSQRYKEELFVKEYLIKHANPEPVSTKMVSEYYRNNLAEFGKANLKTVEILKKLIKPSEAERDLLLASVAEVKQVDDWKSYAEANSKGLGLTYLQTKTYPGLLEPQVESVVNKLKVGEVSEVIFANGIPIIVRVANQLIAPPKPLAEVSADIRKKLAPLQLKKAVKKASEEATKEAEVIIK
jgi:hypothetical protein